MEVYPPVSQAVTKVCRGQCGVELPITEFFKNRTCVGGYSTRCKRCDTAARALPALRTPSLPMPATPPTQCSHCPAQHRALVSNGWQRDVAAYEVSCLQCGQIMHWHPSVASPPPFGPARAQGRPTYRTVERRIIETIKRLGPCTFAQLRDEIKESDMPLIVSRNVVSQMVKSRTIVILEQDDDTVFAISE